MGLSFIYVIHLHQPLSHAGHYAGCTAALRNRLRTHANGHGACFTRALHEQGLTWELGGLYSCSHAEMRRHERSLKNMKNTERYCQLCNPYTQASLPGCQKENIFNVGFPANSTNLRDNHVDLGWTRELEQHEADMGMKFILSLMKKDKDALGFVPVGGVKGISRLLEARQIILAYENGEPCGYTFYTRSLDETCVNIHQACVADDARLKGHGAALVQHVLDKHPAAKVVAKVRDDLAANHFWTAMEFAITLTKKHKTSQSTIHHYERLAEPQPKEKL